MRRPLLLVALCLVLLAAVRIKLAEADGPNCANSLYGNIDADTLLPVTGQVYQKEENSIYIKSVVIYSDALAQSAVYSRQEHQVVYNLICETDRATKIPLGSKVMLRGNLSSFSGATNPGGFDGAVYYRTLGIGGKLKDAEVLWQSDDFWIVREQLYQWKNNICNRIYSVFDANEGAVVEALLLGEKDNLNEDLKNLYMRNGILHILSISSMHITIIGLSVYKLLRKIGMPMVVAAFAGSFLLILYGSITGFSVSVVRAIGMFLIKMLGEVTGRTYDMLTALCLVGAGMVTMNPYYLQNGGFLLSFSCVLGICILYPVFMPEFCRRTESNRPCNTVRERYAEIIGGMRLKERICSSFFLSFCVTVATLPVQLCLYYEVPVYSVFLNLLIVPFLKPLMFASLFAVLTPQLGMFKNVVCIILKGYEWGCRCFDELPFQNWNPGCPKEWQIITYYVILLAVVLIKKYYKLHGKRMCVTWMCALVSAIFFIGIRPEVKNSVTFLDVGQGDCIVIRTASGENYLFDCGSVDRSNVGKYVLLPYLKYYGIRKLDGVFVSHPDTDHYSGILELLAFAEENHIAIGQLILPDIADELKESHFEKIKKAVEGSKNPVRPAYVSAGEEWQCDDVRFLCVYPDKKVNIEDKNEYSQCFLIEFIESGWTLLLTGDVSSECDTLLTERLKKEKKESVTVLKVAHHGSKYSTGKDFLDKISPEISVISCSATNVYGHPHPETLQRLKDVGSEVLSTVEFGAIMIEMEEKLAVYSFK